MRWPWPSCRCTTEIPSTGSSWPRPRAESMAAVTVGPAFDAYDVERLEVELNP
jgi:hypothetical protein